MAINIMSFNPQVLEPPRKTPRKTAQKPSKLRGIMAKILSKSQQQSGDHELAGTGMTVNAAVEDYLSKPMYEDMDTFHFWKEYSKSGDVTQRCLANLARLHLTPPPTSTDVERLGSIPQSLSMSWQVFVLLIMLDNVSNTQGAGIAQIMVIAIIHNCTQP